VTKSKFFGEIFDKTFDISRKSCNFATANDAIITNQYNNNQLKEKDYECSTSC
jgi:hypothetical protein